VTLSARAASVEDTLPWRDLYRGEMNCQIIHDSLHTREGWTQSYLLLVDDVVVGYGSVAVSGPWKGKPTIFEFYVLPQNRCCIFDLFFTLLTATGTTLVESDQRPAACRPVARTRSCRYKPIDPVSRQDDHGACAARGRRSAGYTRRRRTNTFSPIGRGSTLGCNARWRNSRDRWHPLPL